MGTGFKHGAGGGNPLNFKVVGNPQPSNPKENTIWINTDDKITSYLFNATQPTNPTEGMAWIATDTSSSAEFNALKKNGIQVYPIYAKQYVSGAWVEKTAKTYQNGEWVDWWNGELYDYGNEFEFVTGGWSSNGYKVYGKGGTISKGTDGKLNTQGIFGTEKLIKTTGYNRVRFIGYSSVNDTDHWFFLSRAKSFTNEADSNVVAHLYPRTIGNYDVSIDLNSYSGEYYIGGVMNGYLTKVVLE